MSRRERSRGYQRHNDRDDKQHSHSRRDDHSDRKQRRRRSRDRFDFSDDEQRSKHKKPNVKHFNSRSPSPLPAQTSAKEVVEKERPNFAASGILAEFQNKVNGVTLKFTEPQDAGAPEDTYGLYLIENGQAGKCFTLKSRDQLSSAFLIGLDP